MTGYAPRSGGFQFGHGFPMTLWVKRLLIANFVVFIATGMLGVVPPAVFDALAFGVPDFLLRPWSLLTYMFLHGSFIHLFGNMLILFFFGPPLENKWGGRFFIRYYLVCGLGGALFSVLLYSMLGPTQMVGASGAMFGLLLAFAMNWPDAQIFLYFLFPVPAKWFVGVLGLLTLFATVRGPGGGVAHWAHLGGMVAGFVMLRWGDQIGRATKKAFIKDRPSHVKVERGGAKTTTPRKPPRRGRKGVDGDSLDEVDRILDKIRESGMESLSEKERTFLDDMSRRYKSAPEGRPH